MKDLIDELPGLDLPVGEVTDRLELMWESDTLDSPSAFRASQMNVVLHFGWDVTCALPISGDFGWFDASEVVQPVLYW